MRVAGTGHMRVRGAARRVLVIGTMVAFTHGGTMKEVVCKRANVKNSRELDEHVDWFTS